MSTSPISAAALRIEPNAPNHRSVWSRLFWKEWRQSRYLLLTMLIVWAFSATLIGFNTIVNTQPDTLGKYCLMLTWTLSCILALAAGVFPFAPEYEQRTSGLLAQLPVTSRQVVLIKLLVALFTLASFITLCGLAQFLVAFRIPELGQINEPNTMVFSDTRRVLGYSLFLPLECLACGALCSLFFRRAVVSILAAGAAILIGWVVGVIVTNANDLSFWGVIAWQTLKLLLLGGLVGTIGSTWLGRSCDRAITFGREDHELAMSAATSKTGMREPKPTADSGRIYASLFWQSLRQSKYVLIGALIALVPVLIWLVFATFLAPHGWPSFARRKSLQFCGTWLAVVTFICAQLTFSGDQYQQRFLFFQQHREHGRELWLSRIAPVWAFGLLASFVVVIAAALLNALNPQDAKATGSGVLMIITGLAIGQFSSMFFRKSAYPFLFSLLAMGASATWFNYVFYFDAIRGTLLYLPPILLLFGLTWWRAPNWLADKFTIRDGSLAAIAVVTCVACMIGLLAYSRLSEIPPSSFSLADYRAEYAALTSESEQASPTALLAQATDQFVEGDADYAWNNRPFSPFDQSRVKSAKRFLDANLESLASLEQALTSIDSAKFMLTPESLPERKAQYKQLSFLLATAAQVDQLEGRPDEALKRWITLLKFQNRCPLDTLIIRPAPARDFTTVQAIVRCCEVPALSKADCQQAIETLSYSEDSWLKFAAATIEQEQVDFANWFEAFKQSKQVDYRNLIYGNAFLLGNPWEIERSKRRASQLIERSVGPLLSSFANMAADASSSYSRTQVQSTNLGRSSSANGQYVAAWGPERFVSKLGNFQAVRNIAIQRLTERRHASVRIALVSFMREHGHYPAELQELVPEYFEKLPVDILGGGSFVYSATGITPERNVGDDTNDKPNPLSNIRTRNYELGTSLEQAIQLASSFVPENTPYLLPWSSFRATHSGTATWTYLVQSQDEVKQQVTEKLVSGFSFESAVTNSGYRAVTVECRLALPPVPAAEVPDDQAALQSMQ